MCELCEETDKIPQLLHEVHVLMGHQVIEKPLQAPIKHKHSDLNAM